MTSTDTRGFENIPERIKNLPQWGPYKLEMVKGRKTKVPYQLNGQRASSTDPKTWTTFARAVAAVQETDAFSGVFFMLTEENGLIFIDLDSCIKDDVAEKWATDIIQQFESYTEKSQSGRGFHILIEAKKPFARCESASYPHGIEIYDHARQCCLTGDVVKGLETIKARQEPLNALFKTIFGETQYKAPSHKPTSVCRLSDQVLIQKAMGSKTGERFRSLWNGSIAGYNGDKSAADMALMDDLCFWTQGDYVQMERLFSASGLGQRDKWQNRPGYRECTIEKALRDTTNYYDPNHDIHRPAVVPEIMISNRKLQDLSQEALNAVLAANDPPVIFTKSGNLVRIIKDSDGNDNIEVMKDGAIRGVMARTATYVKITKDGPKLAFPPVDAVKDIMGLSKWDGFNNLNGIVTCPIIRQDGSVLTVTGYDKATGLYYVNGDDLKINIAENPTKEDAVEAARYMLKDVLGDFPFLEDGSAANALAALITPLIIDFAGAPAQMGLFDKPSPGTGASLLTEIMSIIATGKPVISQAMPNDEPEWKKTITTILLGGPQIVVMDNVDGVLKARSLSQLLTSRTWGDRLLATNNRATLRQTAAWYSTGNNIQLGGDMGRRCYWIRQDAQSARPWEGRTFKIPNITKWTAEHRGELLSKLLTMVRAWVCAGEPAGDGPILGNYEEWCRIVGGILTYAGVKGFQGNRTALYEILDQENGQWDAFIDQWQQLHRNTPISASTLKIELEDIKDTYKGIRDEMPEEVAEAIAGKGKGSISLARVLAKHKEQVFPSGRSIKQTTDTHRKTMVYTIITIPQPAGVKKEAKWV